MEKYFHFDRNKTIEELDGEEWEDPKFSSHLVSTCYELRKKQLLNFDIEDLRIMIGQNLSLNFLVPLALEILKDNVFAEGNFYCGDLLESLLGVDKEFWKNNTDYKCDLENMLQKNIENLKSKLDSFHNKFE
jgi:hypothetical protein